eukprot:gene12780-15620_t
MIQNNSLLATFVMFFVLTVTIYNCAAVYVTKYLSAIWHAILDNFRPITIWGVGLFIHASGSQYGEAWTDSSYLQLIALIILLFGTAVYNGNVVVFAEDAPQVSKAETTSLLNKNNTGSNANGNYQSA